MKNACLDAIVNELRILGIPFTKEYSGGQHIKIRWQVGPRTPKRIYVVGQSPSDWRAHKAARADVRRMLRQDGVALPNRT